MLYLLEPRTVTRVTLLLTISHEGRLYCYLNRPTSRLTSVSFLLGTSLGIPPLPLGTLTVNVTWCRAMRLRGIGWFDRDFTLAKMV